MMKTFVQVLLLFLSLQVAAQQKRIIFESSVQGGLLEGESGSAFQLGTINGIQYKKWSAGIGAGLDYYHTRSIPLYLAFRKTFGSGTKAPFLYANGGYHFPWLTTEDKSWWYSAESKGGLYFDAGIGYQLPVFKKNSALFFTAGFSQKNFTHERTDGPVIAIYPPIPPSTRFYEYNMRRLSIQTGLRF